MKFTASPCAFPTFVPEVKQLTTNIAMEGTAGVSPDSLATWLSCGDSQATLVIDCRPFMSYNLGHIVNAVNVHCPPILKRRSGGFVALENIVPCSEQREMLTCGQYCRVVVYDQNTTDLSHAATDSNLYSVVKSLLQQVNLEQVYYISGGYDAFCDSCPLLCATQQFSPFTTARQFEVQARTKEDEPVEILPHLLLGNEHHSSSRELLHRLGVTALINVSTTCSNHFQADFRYLNIPVRDSASDDLGAWFSSANEFIDAVQKEGGRVLVHCYAGRSRSATVCLAYLMRTCNMSLDAAYEHVRARRHVIDPNLNFMRQLQDYGRVLALAEATSCLPKTSAPSSVHPPPLLFPSAFSSAALHSGLESNESPAADSGTEQITPSSASPDVQCYFSFSTTEFTFPRTLTMTPLWLPS